MSLQQKTINGVKWNLLSTISTTLFGIILLWVLSHIFTPTQYGVISATIIISNFCNMLLDFGISNSIIRSDNVTKKELNSLYILNVIIGFFIFITVFLLSDKISNLFNASEGLATQIKLVSFGFIISAFTLQPKAIMNKELLFNHLSIITILTNIINFIFSISLAYFYHSVWCVALAFIISNFFNMILTNYISKANKLNDFSFQFDIHSICKHIKYGSQLVLDSFINQISINSYPVLMSRLVSLAAIGGYNISYSISIALFERLNPVLSHALFPAFSRIKQDDTKLSHNFLKVTCFASLVNFPILLGMFTISDYVVDVFFDPKWGFITPIVSILCWTGVIRSLDVPVIAILLVRAKMYMNIYLGFFKLLIGLPLAWYLGSKYSITGIVLSFLIVQLFNTFCAMIFIIRPILNISALTYLRTLSIPFLTCLPMIILSELLKRFLLNFYFPNHPLFNMMVIILFSISIFLISIFLNPIREIKEFKGVLIGNILGKGKL